MSNRNIVVIGASLGGVQALRELVGHLPGDLPAAVFIVQHVSPSSPTMLPSILATRSDLPVRSALNGEPIGTGHVYIAPSDHHLVMDEHHVRLARSPKENGARPSIDTLFRAAAAYHRSAVIGVVLTGQLHDGAAGMVAIKRCGGIAIAQDPSDAQYPSMPLEAIRLDDIDHVLPLDLIAGAINRLTREEAPPSPPVPPDVMMEAKIAESGSFTIDRQHQLGAPTAYSCPECGGPLWQVPGEPRRFRCHTGHAFTASNLLSQQSDEVERSLWGAIRALHERAKLLMDQAGAVTSQNRRRADALREQSEQAAEQAAVLQDLIATAVKMDDGPAVDEKSP